MPSYKLIKSPEEMWEHFEGYIKEAHERPIIKREYVGKDGREVDTPLAVPITFEGFKRYLCDHNVIRDLCDYSQNRDGAYEDYVHVIDRIRNYCFVNNFNGAAVRVWDAGLIGKKIGLVEKSEAKITMEQPLFPDVPTDNGNK